MTTAQQLIPTGTWNVDAVHSTAIFSVDHAAVGTFRGQFRKIDGGVADGVLRGEVTLDTLDVFDDNARARRIYRAVGFREDGLLREAYVRPDGARVTQVLMSILRAEWESLREREAEAPSRSAG